MMLVLPVKKERRLPFVRGHTDDMLEIVRLPKSDIPAVTHIDYSARIQTVERDDHKEFYDLIKSFEELTGCGVVINTSFNVRGEPIVCTPKDAVECFLRTDFDILSIGDFLISKS